MSQSRDQSNEPTLPIPDDPQLLKAEAAGKPQFISQAERVLRKFGGPRRLAVLLKMMGRDRNVATIYKWTYPRDKGGSDGIIPTSAWDDIMAAARFDGIIISSEDIDPRPEPIKLLKCKTLKP